MKNEFVPYEEALALKELGFDNADCLGVYYGESEHDIDFEDGFVLSSRGTQYYAQKGFQNGILAPLYQQAFRWFIEKYFIIGYIVPKNGKYTYYIISNRIELEMNGFKTYEEAELACLRKLIEIVKEKS